MPVRATVAVLLLGGCVLGGCVTTPPGPTVSVLPGPGKSFERFQEEDAFCRDYARRQVAGTPEQADAQLIRSAVIGTLLGAGLGAALGGGQGAGVGAAAGTLIGTGVSSGQGAWSQMSIQQRYDVAYMQCMYAKGNQVPGYTVVAAPYPPPPPPPVP